MSFTPRWRRVMAERQLVAVTQRGQHRRQHRLRRPLVAGVLGWNRSRLNISSGLVMKNGPTTVGQRHRPRPVRVPPRAAPRPAGATHVSPAREGAAAPGAGRRGRGRCPPRPGAEGLQRRDRLGEVAHRVGRRDPVGHVVAADHDDGHVGPVRHWQPLDLGGQHARLRAHDGGGPQPDRPPGPPGHRLDRPPPRVCLGWSAPRPAAMESPSTTRSMTSPYLFL